MENQFSRTERLIGEAAQQRLFSARVAVFGIGGVGSFAAEALARAGVGTLDLIDPDRVSLTNINRQLYATHSTIGEYKVDIAARRLADINPDGKVNTFPVFFDEETAAQFDFSQYDYVIDAIDTVSSKLLLVEMAKKAGAPIISAMGAGNKLDPTAFEVADIAKTTVCPLARVMRRELKARGISHLKVVYSKEPPITPEGEGEKTAAGRPAPGSVPFVPPVMGFILAGEVIRDLI